MEQGSEITQKYCEQCGVAGRAEARFCVRCGVDMATQPPQASKLTGPTGDPAGQETDHFDGASPIGLGRAWLTYLGAIGLWVGVVLLPNGRSTGMVALIIYFGLGFFMTRYLMRRLIQFHPMHNTLANVVSAKIWMFLLWPLRMPILLFTLTVNSSL